MKLLIDRGSLYADGLFFSYCEAPHGRATLQSGRYPVTTQYSHAHGEELPLADGLGWIGPANNTDAAQCDVVLGRVRKSDALLPCPSYVRRLIALLDATESAGKSATLVIA